MQHGEEPDLPEMALPLPNTMDLDWEDDKISLMVDTGNYQYWHVIEDGKSRLGPSGDGTADALGSKGGSSPVEDVGTGLTKVRGIRQACVWQRCAPCTCSF